MTPLRRFTLVAAGIALCSTVSIAGRHTAYAQTQLETNESTYRDFLKSDKQLNVLYQQLLKKYSPSDPYNAKTRKKIVLAERAWVAYRDSQADAEASWQAEGGSMYPACFNITAKEITDERIKTIKRLIAGPNPNA